MSLGQDGQGGASCPNLVQVYSDAYYCLLLLNAVFLLVVSQHLRQNKVAFKFCPTKFSFLMSISDIHRGHGEDI